MGDNLCLEDRVNAFNRLQLPSQPRFIHMGTGQLIRDLWNEVQWLRFQIENLLRAHGVKKGCDEMIASQSQSPGMRAS